MLAPAIYHADALREAYARIIIDPRFTFYFNYSYREFTLDLATSSWGREELVSINTNGEVEAYLCADIDRDVHFVSGLRLMHFGTDHLIFSRDLMRFMGHLLSRYRKVCWGVIVGNPIEPSYDRVCERLGGRIVGTKREDVKLLDGSIRDFKLYEVIASEVPASILRRLKGV